jgi:hypothetical protein
MAPKEEWPSIDLSENKSRVFEPKIAWQFKWDIALRTAAQVIFFVTILTVATTLGWIFSEYAHKPTFSIIKHKLARDGQAVDGQIIGELGQVCSDDARTPISCHRLFESIRNPIVASGR